MPSSNENELNDDRIRREAADWFARLRAPDGPDYSARFETWLAEDPAHRAAYDRLARRWDQTAFLANTPLGKRRDLSRAASGRTPAARHAAAAAIAALALVSIITFGLVDARHPQASPTQVLAQTNDGPAIRTIALTDGSRVTLDSGASVRIAYTSGERRIRLERGRARFAVAHDPSRRFIVAAGEGSIIAHGTVFDVTIDRAGVRVALLKGQVEVRKLRASGGAHAGAVVLRPGQQVTFDSAKPISPISRADDQQWPNGMLVFDGMRLADAIAQFNSRNHRQIRLEAEHGANLRISGAYRANDPAGFAVAVAGAFKLRTRQGVNQTIILSAQSE